MSKHPVMCDLCQEGTLEVKQGLNVVTYKDNSRNLEMSFCECNVCGSEMVLPEQTRDNKRRMTAFKKEVDGLLTGFEVRAFRERLGLSVYWSWCGEIGKRTGQPARGAVSNSLKVYAGTALNSGFKSQHQDQ